MNECWTTPQLKITKLAIGCQTNGNLKALVNKVMALFFLFFFGFYRIIFDGIIFIFKKNKNKT